MKTERFTSDEINLSDLLRKGWKNRKMIFFWTLAGGIAAAGIAFCLRKEYTASAKIVTQAEARNILPELSGLTSLTGINLNTLQPEENLGTALYPDIVASTPFLAEISRIKVSGNLLSTYLSGFKHESVQISDTLPANRKEYRLLEILRKQIEITTDKKSGVTTISATFNDPSAAAVAVDSIVVKLKRYLNSHRTQKARENFSFIEARFEEAREKYYTGQQEYARFSDANRHLARESALIERDRLYQEQQMAYNLYSQLAGQLEMAKLKVKEQTLEMTIIEPPVIPARHSFPKRSLIVFIGLLAGGAVSLFIFWGRELTRKQ